MAPAGKRASTPATAGMSEPSSNGSERACASSRPSGRNSAAAQSPPSRAMEDTAARIMADCMRSAAP
jgi:hypothetical protein